jgi:hypothetical protein
MTKGMSMAMGMSMSMTRGGEEDKGTAASWPEAKEQNIGSRRTNKKTRGFY